MFASFFDTSSEDWPGQRGICAMWGAGQWSAAESAVYWQMKIIRLGTKILGLLQFWSKCNQLLSAPSSDNKPYYRLLVSRNVSKNYAVNIVKDSIKKYLISSIVKDVRYCNKHIAFIIDPKTCKCIYVKMSTNYRDTSTEDGASAECQVYEWYSTRPQQHPIIFCDFFLRLSSSVSPDDRSRMTEHFRDKVDV